MTREDRALLRQTLGWLKPEMHIEIAARDLLALLEDADRLEAEVQAQRERRACSDDG